MGGELLNAEYGRVMASTAEMLKDVHGGLTVDLDGWTDASNNAVAASTVTLPSRVTSLLKVYDITDESHTGEYWSGAWFAVFCVTASAMPWSGG